MDPLPLPLPRGVGRKSAGIHLASRISSCLGFYQNKVSVFLAFMLMMVVAAGPLVFVPWESFCDISSIETVLTSVSCLWIVLWTC